MMRRPVLGLVLVGLMVSGVYGAPKGPSGPGGVAAGTSSADKGLIALSTVVGDKYQQVTVIDPKLRKMSVYHIELATGKIALRSVRSIEFDFQLTDFNGESPLPREIQALLEPR